MNNDQHRLKNNINTNYNYFPSITDIEKAAKVLDNNDINKTPLQKSNTFSKIIGHSVFLKNESIQTTGTFKIRGATYKIDKIIHEEKIKENGDNTKIHGVIAASAGNHAQGVAYAASMKNIPCTIIMPTHAPLSKIAATKSYGAKVILKGEDYDDALALAEKISKEENLLLIHAYDDFDIIAGQGTIGLEILEDLPNVDEIYIPIGGGGLAAGIAIAIKTIKPDVKIFGVESDAYPAMRESVQKGFVYPIKKGYTIADSISIKSPGNLTFRIIREYLDDIVLVDDSSIVKAMFLLMEREKLVIEPSGAVGLAYLLKLCKSDTNYANKNVNQKNVVVLLSGGNMDTYLLGQIVSKGLMQTGRLFKVFVLLQDKPGAFKRVLDVIVELGINIVEVQHDRLSSDIPTGMAGVSLSLEIENESYAERLFSSLKEIGIYYRL